MKKLIILAVGVSMLTGAMAKEKAGFQASLTPDIAVHDRDTEIEGFSIGVWGENPQKSLTIGYINGSKGESAGFTFNFIFLPALYNYTEDYTGVHWGVVNNASGKFVGWQGGAVNLADELVGVQTGFVNWNRMSTGLQWGFVNYTESARNLFQLGLVNIIADNPWFSNFPGELAQGFVIVNWSFGGDS